jgi:hypothetical protein
MKLSVFDLVAGVQKGSCPQLSVICFAASGTSPVPHVALSVIISEVSPKQMFLK